jgi:hypothetical protein
LALALLVPSAQVQAQAQTMGGSAGGFGGGHSQHQQKADKSETRKPKAGEKAYAAALKTLPDKQFDPWHGVR